ncbi:hypothetical protein L9F63_011216, partial [Diploptera punctata]
AFAHSSVNTVYNILFLNKMNIFMIRLKLTGLATYRYKTCSCDVTTYLAVTVLKFLQISSSNYFCIFPVECRLSRPWRVLLGVFPGRKIYL